MRATGGPASRTRWTEADVARLAERIEAVVEAIEADRARAQRRHVVWHPYRACKEIDLRQVLQAIVADRPLREIAAAQHVTEQRISQIKQIALMKARFL